MIVEVVLGFGIAMVGLTAILQLTSRSVNNSGVAQREARASRLADEGIDWVKGQATALGWVEFVGKSVPITDPHPIYCINDLLWTLGTCPTGSVVHNTEFTRNLEMYHVVDVTTSKTLVTALVTVTWNDGDRTETINRAYQFVPY